ncbi:hypothetical protein ACRYI5_00570 [Furfurilactobacillus sp. WILCCON 0119]|uniref:hypothetical protein n=1 Tax=Furfurilactobacillus entadae TaxID=2922307 RepID=UPI0035E7CD0B
MRHIITAIIFLLAAAIFGGVVWITEIQHLTGLPLAVLWIGAFLITTGLIAWIKIWQLRRHQQKQQESTTHE